jgi:FkbM family methyltransferase
MIKSLVHQTRMRLPLSLRRLAAATPFLGSVLRRLDPLTDSNYVWKLPEPLAGMRFRVFDPSERQYVTARYEPSVVAAIRSVVEPGMTCVDAGAHIGYMTLLMATLVGSEGWIFSFEPSPVNCDRLRVNIELNAIENATVVQAFVSSTDGTAPLGIGASSFEYGLAADSEVSTTVDSVALERYFADQHVDFVKLDVEGADELAVQGMRGILTRDKPTILIEDHGAPTIAAKKILGGLGYRFTEVDNAHALALPPV